MGYGFVLFLVVVLDLLLLLFLFVFLFVLLFVFVFVGVLVAVFTGCRSTKPPARVSTHIIWNSGWGPHDTPATL